MKRRQKAVRRRVFPEKYRDQINFTNKKKLTLLGSVEERTILLEAVVNLNEVGASEELHEHARGDNGGDTELHEGSTVGGKDSTHPVERVRRVGGHDSVQGDLRANQEDEEGDSSPENLLPERDLVVVVNHRSKRRDNE